MTSVSFGDLFVFIRNGINVRQDKSGRGLPITRIETISDATVDGSRVGYANLRESECLGWLLQPGDILFSHINSVEHIGKCAVYCGSPARLVHGMNLLCLRCDQSRLVPEFAKYLIRGSTFRAELSRFVKKAVNQASVSIGDLKTIRVLVPSLPEQRRIAEVLDRAEALRAKRRAALAQLDTLTQSIFIDMFGDPATNPKGWPRARLGDLVLNASDGPHVSPVYTETGVPFISTRHIRPGDIAWQDLKFISQADADVQWKKCKPKLGDVLYTKGGTTGLAAAVRTDRAFAVWVHVAVLRPDPTKTDPIWLESMLNSRFCYMQSQVLTHGIANHDLGLSRMVKISVLAPDLAAQRDFASRVGGVEELRATCRASLAQLDTLFASLQHRAFRGEL